MAVRMRDVADRAGVSVRTVSNVVNDYHYVRPSTRERVQQALEELGYEVNAAARSLKSGRTGMVALVVPELRSPYFAELSDAVVRAAVERGYTVLIEVTEADPERERKVLVGGRRHLTDGVLFSPVRLPGSAADEPRPDFPLVVLGESDLGHAFDHVGIDNEAAVRALVQHLLADGRTRIAALGANPRLPAAVIRLRALRATLAEAGLEPHTVVTTPTWDRHVGASAVAGLLDRRDPPDAVVAFNDTLALGALSGLRERGVPVPDEVAVVGIDDIDEATYAGPPLTTISPDLDQIAATGLDLLTEQIDRARQGGPQRRRAPRHLATAYELVVRGSSTATPSPARDTP